ncbi:MAG: transposase InsO family protein [Bacteriovoracaceae bacterium]|jgi:putative transposase
MDKLQGQVPITFMSYYFNKSRSGFYAWKNRQNIYHLNKKQIVLSKIETIFEDSFETYGSPRVTLELIEQGINISLNTVAKYMKELNLDARLKKKFKVQTTDSNHILPIAPRLFKSEEELPEAPGEVLAGDITYIKTPSGFMYLSVVMDLFNREIIGWSLDHDLSKDGVIKALNLAIKKSSPDAQVIFHSDRGSQYASEAFRKLLKQKNIVPSMSRKGNCYDNCYVESFFKTLKSEWIYRHDIFDSKHLRSLIFEYIEAWYNTKRKHSSLDNLSPRMYKQKYLAS